MRPPSTLGALFTKHGSDKDQAHSYGPLYDELLAPAWDRVRAVLEVGILGGASLRAWDAYFPARVGIWGMDHHADLPHGPRLTCVRANSMVRAEVDAALAAAPPFDLIVDDGGHWLEEQIPTYHNLIGRVRPGGLYVVEDLQSTEAMRWFYDEGFTIHDLRWVKGRGDDVVAVLRTPE